MCINLYITDITGPVTKTISVFKMSEISFTSIVPMTLRLLRGPPLCGRERKLGRAFLLCATTELQFGNCLCPLTFKLASSHVLKGNQCNPGLVRSARVSASSAPGAGASAPRSGRDGSWDCLRVWFSKICAII